MKIIFLPLCFPNLLNIMKQLVPLLLLCLLGIGTVLSVLVDPQTSTYCSYLMDKIYCAGDFGDTFGTPSDMIALSVHNTTPIETGSLKFSWDRITFSNNLEVANREMAQVVASPDRTKMFIQGGYSASLTAIDSPFIMFNAAKNEWASLSDFERDGLNDGQIRRASVSYVSSIKKLVFYGGVTNLRVNQSAVVDGVEYSTIQSSTGPYLPFGFNQLTTFDMGSEQWAEIGDARGLPNNDFRYAMNSFSVPGSDSVYFLGGYARSRVDTSNATRLPFNTLSQVSFPDHQWTTHNLTSLLPMFRDFFTTTLLPDSKTVLLYGGASIEGKVVPDTEICYLLNLDTKDWRKCPLEMPTNVGASRYSHSAVLVENKLFILFGRDSESRTLNDIIVLDVSNIDHIKYEAMYAYHTAEGGGLGTGAIVGIAVGCVVLIAIIIGAIVYLRKKKGYNKADSTKDFPANWDNIEDGLDLHSESQNATAVNDPVQYSNNIMKPMEMDTVTYAKPNH
ncbi:hypothetical protein BDB01DRAFT_580794 [Pilobolus umbonatus]|nr:hypothetical protein BDB01DRAFT_580794 [Pilobolus umbonatus]